MFCNWIGSIQSCAEASWKVSERDEVKYLTWTHGCVSGHEERPFLTNNRFHYFAESREEPGKRLEPTARRWKNTENTVFAAKLKLTPTSRFEEPDDPVKWSDRKAPERHAAQRPPTLRQKIKKNKRKTQNNPKQACSVTSNEGWWCWNDSNIALKYQYFCFWVVVLTHWGCGRRHLASMTSYRASNWRQGDRQGSHTLFTVKFKHFQK